MRLVLSPAKSLDFESRLPPLDMTPPAFEAEALPLVQALRTLSAEQLSALMDISPKLASLNQDRNQRWQLKPGPDLARPAILAFHGDVYEGLDVQSLGLDDLRWAQQHLRILSGLYGLLRPFDALQPYRLEMGTRLANPRGKDLYAYWGQTVTDALAQEIPPEDWLLNLASEEYFKVVQAKRLGRRVVSPVFQDEKNGQFKIISFYAKRARGLMARHVIAHRITEPEGLLGFDAEGYGYAPEVSTADAPVFRRLSQTSSA